MPDPQSGFPFHCAALAFIDTTTSAGKLWFGIFASLAEFERDPIIERTKAVCVL